MSNQEFENYLALLSGLLRLEGGQRTQIAAELRDHFDERLDDLLARGMSREEAIAGALREFGDAAGLAAAFSSLARNRKRRWIVRISSLSAAAALVALFITLAAIWPDNRPGPQPPGAIAQQPAAATPAEKASSGAKAGEPSASELKLKAALAQRTSVEFLDLPLKDALAFLGEQHGVQSYVNSRALMDEGLTVEDPITLSLKDVRLETVLDLVLEQVGGLTYVERDGVLMISSITALAGASEVRVYNCRDLLALGKEPVGGAAAREAAAVVKAPQPAGGEGGFGGGFGGAGVEIIPRMQTEEEHRAERLMAILTVSIEPSSWSEQGGFGTVSEFNGLLVVNHNARTQQQVEKVLTMLREAAGLPATPTATSAKKAE